MEFDFILAFTKTIAELTIMSVLFHFSFDFFIHTTDTKEVQQVEVLNIGDMK